VTITAPLTYAWTFGLTPEQEQATGEAYKKGEEFGKYLCTKFEAKAMAEGKSRRQILYEAKVATMKAASLEFKDMNARAVFYETATSIHEAFCNTSEQHPLPAATPAATKEPAEFADHDPLDAANKDPVVKKREKQACLWALDYMEKMINRAIARGEADSINYKAVATDIEQAADKFYPDDAELNKWFILFATHEIQNLAQQGKSLIENHVFPEDALKEWRQDCKEWRNTLNTDPLYN
jgi:hypothetical protein